MPTGNTKASATNSTPTTKRPRHPARVPSSSKQSPLAPKISHEEDVFKNRALAAMSYFWIFCIIPLVAKRESPYTQFHAKQGVVVAFVWFLLWMVNIIPLLGQI